jgi:hypothetical protein
MEAILAFRPMTLKSHKFGSVCGRRGGGGMGRAKECLGPCVTALIGCVNRQHLLGLIPTFKLSSYFSFSSFWLAVRLFLYKNEIDRIPTVVVKG